MARNAVTSAGSSDLVTGVPARSTGASDAMMKSTTRVRIFSYLIDFIQFVVYVIERFNVFPAHGNSHIGITEINFSIGELVDCTERYDEGSMDANEAVDGQQSFHFLHCYLRQHHMRSEAEYLHIIVHRFDK